ncbi:MAG TPA: serine hydrolase domain-containing protein, partial [Trueperaceae bacterium]
MSGPDPAEDVDTFLGRLVPFGYSGAALLARRGEILLSEGYGLADRRVEAPNTPDTVFSLGSITKQFTAAAVLKLQERGLVDVASTIDAYLPEIPPDKAKVTLHHLLTHTSGVVEYLSGDYEPLSRPEAVRIGLGAPLRFEPGSSYGYSNGGYSLLAAIVELVSGQGYEEFLNATFFAPLGMSSTGYRAPTWEGRTVARSYVDGVDRGTNLEKEFPSWAVMGNGEMLSTTLDMYRWHQALMGADVLSAEFKQALYSPFRNGYVYGRRVTEGRHGRRAEHGGASSWGSCSYFRRYLDADLMFIVFCNRVDDGVFLPGAIREHVSALAFGEQSTLPPAAPVGVESDLERLEGERTLAGGGSVRLVPSGGHLRLLPLDGAARDELFPGMLGRAEFEARSLQIVRSAAQGDLGPLTAARPAGRPTEAVERLVREFSGGRPQDGFELLGTAPSQHVSGAFDTVIGTSDRESSLLLVWQDRLLY